MKLRRKLYQSISTSSLLPACHHDDFIEVEFPNNNSEHPDRPLSFEEKNPLRYVSGHICHKIHTNLEGLSTVGKDDIFCIMSFAGDEKNDEMEVWVNAIDWGGGYGTSMI